MLLPVWIGHILALWRVGRNSPKGGSTFGPSPQSFRPVKAFACWSPRLVRQIFMGRNSICICSNSRRRVVIVGRCMVPMRRGWPRRGIFTIVYTSPADITQRLRPKRDTAGKGRTGGGTRNGVFRIFGGRVLRHCGVGSHRAREAAVSHVLAPKGRSLRRRPR